MKSASDVIEVANYAMSLSNSGMDESACPNFYGRNQIVIGTGAALISGGQRQKS